MTIAAEREPGRSPQGPAPLSVKPTLLPGPTTGPPHPALTAIGFPGSVVDFNHRLDAVVSAHQNATGTRPTPGVALDLARSTVPVEHFEPMFTATPATSMQARAHAALAAHGQSDPSAFLVKGLTDAVKSDTLPTFIEQHHEAVHDAFEDPETRTALTKALYQRGVSNPAQVLAAAIFPTKPNALGKIINAPASPVEQVTLGIGLGIPTLTFEEGKGVVESVKQKSAKPFLRTNEQLAKAAAAGVKRDVMDPKDNIGNLLLDLWGAASLVGGVAARGAAVSKALSEGAGTAAVTRAALSRARTGTYELGPGADVPLSSNPLAAKVQGLILDKRVNGLTAAGDTEAVPMGAAAVTIADRAQTIADGLTDPFGIRTNYLSVPNKIQRQLRAAARIDRDMRMAVMDPALKVTRSAVNTNGAIARFGPKRWLGLSAVEQKAIQVLSTDDPNPFDTWETFHNAAIKNEWGNPADHEAHLALLPAARKAAENPSPKLVKAIAAVKDVMTEQTALRINQLGLTPEIAQSRVAAVGSVIRGDEIVRAAEGHRILLDEPTRLARTPDDELQSRLSTLDKQYEELLNTIAAGEGRPGDYKAVTAIQNAANAKSVRRGRGKVYRTVKEQLRDQGEKKLLNLLRSRPDDPYVQRLTADINEAASIQREIARRNDKAVGLEEIPAPVEQRVTQQNPDAFYLPFVSAAHTRGHGAFWGMRANKYGVPVPSSLPELNHEFTGDSIRAGDFRVDATNLARESYVRTVHVVARVNAWKRLWDDYSVEAPTSEFHQPIRDERAVNEHLKGALSKIEQGTLSKDDIEGIPQDTVDNLNRFLFPNRDELGPDDHVRWIDERLLDDSRPTKPGKVAKTFSAVNEPLRDAMIFLRPAYILNLVNSAQLLATDAGVLAVPNMVRAFKSTEWYGAKETRMLDSLAGEGRMLSYSPADAGRATRLSHALGTAWSAVTDRLFRRAAVIHELRKQGFRTTEEIKTALNDALTDADVMKQVTEASQRAKKAMVEMDNLSWFEKSHLRHWVFVYPWVSRSAVWSLRFLRDHPAQAAIYNEIGQSAELEDDPFLKYAPAWMRDNSVMPVGLDKSGNPIVVNPAAVDTWSTMGEALGLVRGDQTVSDLFGPGGELLLHYVTQRDRFGRQYKNPVTGPLLDTLTGLPQVAAYNRAGQDTHPIPPDNLGDIHGLEKQEAVAAKNPVYVPGSFMNTYGPLMFGGLTPRVLDEAAVKARFWKNAPYPQKVKHTTALMQRQAKLQGELIGTPTVPQPVRDGIALVGARSLAYHDFTAKQGRTPTLRERAEIDIDVLAGRHLISVEQQAELKKRLADAPDDQVGNFRSGVTNKLAYGKELSDWYYRARTVARVANSVTLDEDIVKLIANKLLPSEYKNAANADESTLTKYGRGFLAYRDGIKKLTRQADELRKKNADVSEVAAKLRAYVDEHSAAVTIAGKTLPSYASLAMAHLTPTQVSALKVGLYTQPWLTMSATDKALTGYTTNPKVSEALTAYTHYTSPAYLATQYPEGERSLDATQKAAIIKQLDTAYSLDGALVKDYQESKLPRFERYQQLDIYKQSPHKQAWRDLFERASDIYKAAHPGAGFKPSITASQMHDAWHEWTTDVLPIIERKQPGFYAELKPYLEHDPSFLDEMVTP